jgi:hypothetical protein
MSAELAAVIAGVLVVAYSIRVAVTSLKGKRSGPFCA